MKRKHLYAILAVLALGLLVYAPSLVRDRDGPPVTDSAERVPDAAGADGATRPILLVDTAAVREVLIRRGGEELTLARRDGAWWVDEARAEPARVRALLVTLARLEGREAPTDTAAGDPDFSSPDAILRVFSREETEDVIDRTLAASLRFVRRDGEDVWWVRPADEERAFEVPAATVARLLPTGDALRAASEPE